MDPQAAGNSTAESQPHSSSVFARAVHWFCLPHGGNYRPDIDGLRAVAILSVMAYHMLLPHAAGGFVGVDIFFVISGYLITSIIWREIGLGTFSIVRFYERRVRRILPALAGVLIACIVGGWVFLLPGEFVEFAWSTLAASVSGANIFFWLHAGYFAGPAEMKPLLHTWSLGVEEQFYLLLPPTLLLVARFARRRVSLVLGVIGVVSFAASLLYVRYSPDSAFYLLSSRAWELMVGSLLAVGAIPGFRTAIGRQAAGLVGLGMILYAVTQYNMLTPFPGAAALLPCIGAMLIIAAGQYGSSAVGWLLSLRPVVFVGLISYSLYLWHWPLSVLGRMGIVPWANFMRHGGKLMVLAEVFAAATLSWLFIERPFRGGPRAPKRKALFAAMGATFACIAALAVAILATGGAPSRYSPLQNAIASYLAEGGNPTTERSGTCMVDHSYQAPKLDAANCLRADSAKPNILLFGDSHAAQLWYGLSHEFTELNVMQATAAMCKPLIGAPRAAPFCQNLRDFIFDDYLAAHHPDAILLAGAWNAADLDPLAETIDALRQRGEKVYLAGPNPTYLAPLPRLLVLSIKNGDPELPRRRMNQDAFALDGAMRALAAEKHIAGYISLVDAMCPERNCSLYANADAPMESDSNHLTAEGSIAMAQRIRTQRVLP
jgi:peptidoglycan/LPS O-acetylase OafA/YrhL